MASEFNKYSDQSSYLWRLLYIYFVSHSDDEVVQLASTVYEQDFFPTSDFESLLLQVSEGKIETIYEVAKKALHQKLLGIEKHIFIVAVLVEHKKIKIAEAVQMLNFKTGYNYGLLDQRLKQVVDATWLLNEDTKDQRMSPQDDDLLAEALNVVASAGADIKGIGE